MQRDVISSFDDMDAIIDNKYQPDDVCETSDVGDLSDEPIMQERHSRLARTRAFLHSKHATPPQAESLVEPAMVGLKRAFAGFEPPHNPSLAQWLALKEYVSQLAAIAEG